MWTAFGLPGLSVNCGASCLRSHSQSGFLLKETEETWAADSTEGGQQEGKVASASCRSGDGV
jgi:hypothetical protein